MELEERIAECLECSTNQLIIDSLSKTDDGPLIFEVEGKPVTYRNLMRLSGLFDTDDIVIESKVEFLYDDVYGAPLVSITVYGWSLK